MPFTKASDSRTAGDQEDNTKPTTTKAKKMEIGATSSLKIVHLAQVKLSGLFRVTPLRSIMNGYGALIPG